MAIGGMICVCQQNKLQEDLFLLHKDWRIDIDAHVSGGASDDPHSRVDALAVQVWQLLLSYCTHLIRRYFSHLRSLWLFRTFFDTYKNQDSDIR